MRLMDEAENNLLASIIALVGLYGVTLRGFEIYVGQFASRDNFDVDTMIMQYIDSGIGVISCLADAACGAFDREELEARVCTEVSSMGKAVIDVERLIKDVKNPAAAAAAVNFNDITRLTTYIQQTMTAYGGLTEFSDRARGRLSAGLEEVLKSLQNNIVDADPLGHSDHEPMDSVHADKIHKRYIALCDEGVRPQDAFSAAMLEQLPPRP